MTVSHDRSSASILTAPASSENVCASEPTAPCDEDFDVHVWIVRVAGVQGGPGALHGSA